MLEQVFINVIEITFAVTPIFLLLLFLSKAADKRYAAKLKYWVWLAVAVRLALPINISLPSAPITIQVPAHESSQQISPRATTSTADDNIPQTEPNIILNYQVPVKSAPTQSVSLITLASIAWLCGAIFLILLHFASYLIYLRKIKRWSIPYESGHEIGFYQTLCDKLRIRHPIPIFQCSQTDSPMMIGLFHPCILLPNGEYSPRQLELILRHELLHYKRKDLWFKLLLVFANSLHWFNPLVYLAANRACADLEISCDEAVLKSSTIDYRKEYGETILQVMRGSQQKKPILSTHFSPGKRTIKQRFQNILDTDNKRRGIVVLSAIVILVALAGAFVALKIGNQLNINAAARSISWEEVADNGKDKSASKFLKLDDGVVLAYHQPVITGTIHANNQDGTRKIITQTLLKTELLSVTQNAEETGYAALTKLTYHTSEDNNDKNSFNLQFFHEDGRFDPRSNVSSFSLPVEYDYSRPYFKNDTYMLCALAADNGAYRIYYHKPSSSGDTTARVMFSENGYQILSTDHMYLLKKGSEIIDMVTYDTYDSNYYSDYNFFGEDKQFHFNSGTLTATMETEHIRYTLDFKKNGFNAKRFYNINDLDERIAISDDGQTEVYTACSREGGAYKYSTIVTKNTKSNRVEYLTQTYFTEASWFILGADNVLVCNYFMALRLFNIKTGDQIENFFELDFDLAKTNYKPILLYGIYYDQQQEKYIFAYHEPEDEPVDGKLPVHAAIFDKSGHLLEKQQTSLLLNQNSTTLEEIKVNISPNEDSSYTFQTANEAETITTAK